MTLISACYGMSQKVYSDGRQMTFAVSPLSGSSVSLRRNFRANFTRIRVDRGMRQKDIAREIKVTEKTISRWMDEDPQGPFPEVKQIEKLVKLFECDYGDLLGSPVEIEGKPPRGPVTIVLTGDAKKIAKALREIQAKWGDS